MTVPQPASTAVVTVTYNSSEALASFLESTMQASASPLYVVVADNNSRDVNETARVCSRYGAHLLKLSENRGYGGGMNAAIATLPSRFDMVLVSNPDVVLGPRSVDVLRDTVDRNPRVAAAGPRVLNSDGSTYPSARALPSLRIGLGHSLFVGVWPSNPWTRRYHRGQDCEPEERVTGWLSGSCLFVRRSAFDEVHGFDETFFMYFEDVDLGYRFGKAGWDNLYVPRASVTHAGAHSTRSDPAPMLRAHHQSARHYLNRRYPAPILTPLRLLLGLALRVREQILVARERRERRR
ncbi:MAG: glycosyltransferase family 2 protein [Kineosporiaceae bacterium]|nr:glycosyltransferase family 2 protein [Aeromicrobium sp.]